MGDSDTDTDTDSDSDEDTTDSDDNSFAARFAAQKAADNQLDRFEDQEDIPSEGRLTISLSQKTMANLWGIAALIIVVNMTLCVWCFLKTQNGKKRVRFMEDQYNSEIPIE